ncbi:hypothetical protein FJTKL_13505 [Diaporthe vaccinii]|uniref:ABC transporter n=1 Tax=Diaporthe vaccinii TaxID=105482 RepID=A0ABR4EA77_9PEZI
MATLDAGVVATYKGYTYQELLFCLTLAFFSLCTMVRSAQLSPSPNRILRKSFLGWAKLCVGVAYAVSSTFTLAVLLFWIGTADDKVISMILLQSFSSWCVCITSRVEHLKTVRPSHFLQASLVLSIPHELFWLQRLKLFDGLMLMVLGYTHAVLLVVLICVESCDKRQLFLLEGDRKRSREETSGFFGQRLFWYLNGLFRKAYRQTLNLDNLEGVDTRLLSQEAAGRYQAYWSQPGHQSGRHALLRSIFVVLWKDLCMPILPRLLGLATMLTQPFLISATLTHIQNPGRDSIVANYTILGAFTLSFLCSAVFNAWYSHSTTRFTVKLRSVMISALYDKALRATGQGAELGTATVLMNVDLEKVLEGMKWVHEFWAVPVGIAVSMYILQTNIGVAFLVPLVVLGLATAMTWNIGDAMRSRNLEWVTKTEKRVTMMSKIASSVKEIRMLGFTEVLHNIMIALRVNELLAYRSTTRLWIFVVGIGYAMFPILIFATFTLVAASSLRGGPSFHAEAMFASLSLLKLMAALVLPFLQTMITCQGAGASVDRIQSYLVDDGEAHRSPMASRLPEANTGQRAEADAQGFELQENFARPGRKCAFEIAAADFGFGNGQPLLHKITLAIDSGSFTMVIGRVGSGKSLLLLSLLGELAVLDGQANRSYPDASYCSQPPWLRNVSVRDSILGESAFEAGWYSSVIWACGLDQDFQELSSGDATLVGTGGMSLSGGQKNRVSLARAVYARKPVVVVDDVLSGLDKTTEKLVFSRVFGRNGLLRQMQCTIVLATHSVGWAAQSDKIVVVSEGRIVADGHYDTLLRIPGLWETHCSSVSGTASTEEDIPTQSKSQELEKTEKKAQHVQPESKTKTDADDDYRRKGHAGTLMYYLLGFGKVRIALYILLSLATYTSNAVQFIWVQKLVKESVSVVIFSRSISVFTSISFFAFSVTAIYLSYFFLVLCPRSGLRLHARQLSALMKAKFTALVTKDSGEITNLFSQDTIIVDRLLPLLVLNISTGFLEQTKNIVLLVAATPPIALMIPIPAAIGYMVQHYYLRTSRQLRHLDLEAKAPLCSNFIETLAGSATIRAFGWSGDFKRRNKQLQDVSQAPYYLLQDAQNWLSLVLDLIVTGIISILVGLALFLRSNTDPGYLALALIGVIDLGFSIRVLVLAWTEVETAMSAVTRIRVFLDNTSQEPVRYSDTTDSLWPRHGAVRFRNVSASYTSDPSSAPTLRGIDLEIAAGEKVGICGRTGSGKSSLVATLLGLTHLVAGDILVDGVSTATVPLGKLRRRLITLTQDPLFLEQTVRENLVPWRGVDELGEVIEADWAQQHDPSDEDMICALKSCEIWGKFEAAAPEGGSGLDISMAGVDSLLSEGEKQLFCLARAVLHPGKVVILDEASSCVDAKTDILMQRVLRTEFADRTILAISHSISAVMDFDRVVVMDGGKVAEVDSPKALMANKGSLFAALAKVHSPGEEEENLI